MTNPDNIVRVRARNGGRASVYEANGWAQPYSSGLVEGNGVTQNTSADMNVLVGGTATKPDVVLAENPAGYKIALDLVGQKAITITAPASNKRYSLIVAYTDDLSLSTTQDTVTGSPASCGLIVVNGTSSTTPTVPSDATIRTAITSDGATGSQASYCVVATILVSSTTTIITNDLIDINISKITSKNIDFTTFPGNYTATEQDTGYTWIDGKKIYKRTVNFGALPNGTNKTVPLNIENLDTYIKLEAVAINQSTGAVHMINGAYGSASANPDVNTVYENCFVRKTTTQEIVISTNSDRTEFNAYVTIWYTKA